MLPIFVDRHSKSWECFDGFRRQQASADVRLKAYTTIVQPTLDYASIAWDPYRLTLINQIAQVQHLAVHFIFS